MGLGLEAVRRHARDVASSRAKTIRIGFLLTVLAGVLLFAWRDVSRRNARNEWRDPLSVGVVILDASGPVSALDPAAVATLHSGIGALGNRLSREYERYHTTTRSMIQTVPYGPVAVDAAPPQLEADDWWSLVKYTWDVQRYVWNVDSRAAVPSRGLDSRIYIVATPVRDAAAKWVEGASQQGGRFGFAVVELDESTVDLVLFVAAHELMHTLGASDKYTASGTLIPDGLGDPEQKPLFPQRYAEVMARNRVLGPGREVVPETLDELRVGRLTAREIGWLR